MMIGFCDCEDDMEEIVEAFFNLFYSEYLYGIKNEFEHGYKFNVGIHSGDGSALSRFFGGAYMENYSIGLLSQLTWEVFSEFEGDWASDTAYAQGGVIFYKIMNNSDSDCRKIVEDFARGRIKFTDILGNKTPENSFLGFLDYSFLFSMRMNVILKTDYTKR